MAAMSCFATTCSQRLSNAMPPPGVKHCSAWSRNIRTTRLCRPWRHLSVCWRLPSTNTSRLRRHCATPAKGGVCRACRQRAEHSATQRAWLGAYRCGVLLPEPPLNCRFTGRCPNGMRHPYGCALRSGLQHLTASSELGHGDEFQLPSPGWPRRSTGYRGLTRHGRSWPSLLGYPRRSSARSYKRSVIRHCWRCAGGSMRNSMVTVR
ncbi:hypothetical protein OOOCML_33225 (plasmid) [Cupriavidus necator H16]